MINVLINGINGRMGQEVLSSINEDDNFCTSCGVDTQDKKINEIQVYSDINAVKEKVDVIIDFSTANATFNILDFASKNNIPTVIATTGFSDEQKAKIQDYARKIPVFQSYNMSYEVNLMCEMVARLSKQLPNSDIEIIETHHRNKVDSPSGTALMLADSINKAKENSMKYMYDRHSVRQKRDSSEIGIHSIRGGTEVGKHSVIFFGENESFEITHTVTSRNTFAKGALKAASFLIKQKPGLYNMEDLINYEEL